MKITYRRLESTPSHSELTPSADRPDNSATSSRGSFRSNTLLNGLAPLNRQSNPRTPVHEVDGSIASQALWPCGQDRQFQLIGQTIRPDTARKFLARVDFDGLGRVQGFKQRPWYERALPSMAKALTKADLRTLEKAQIRALTEQASTAERQVPRTEQECLVRMMHALRPGRSPQQIELLEDLRNLWLSGVVTHETLNPLLIRIIETVPHIRPFAEKLNQESQKSSQTNDLRQYHDNIYGRKFESELSRRLIADPPAGVLKAVNSIYERTLNNLNALPIHRQEAVVDRVLTETEKLPRPWFDRRPEISHFLAHPCESTLKSALGNSSDGTDIMKNMYLMHWINCALSKEEHGPEHFKHSDHVYSLLIQPKRGTGTPVLQMDTNNYGIGLAHHPSTGTYPEFQMTRNLAYWRIPNLDTPTSFIKNTLKSGGIYVNDLSGNTSVLLPLMKKMKEDDPSFSPGDGLLGLCMYVGFDGGHSHQDIWATADGLDAFESRIKTLTDEGHEPAAIEELAVQEANAAFGKSISPYDRIANLSADLMDQAKVRQMLSAALDDTVDYCHTLINELGMPK